MSQRPGTVVTKIQAATPLGVAAGLSIPLNNQWAVVPAFFITYVATASVGNRTPTVKLVDSLGNTLMQTIETTVITAGLSARIIGMPGQPFTSVGAFGGFSYFLVPWTIELPAPTGASLVVQDLANIDVNDTVAANITFAT